MEKKKRSGLFFLLMIPLLMLGVTIAAPAEVPSVVIHGPIILEKSRKPC